MTPTTVEHIRAGTADKTVSLRITNKAVVE